MIIFTGHQGEDLLSDRSNMRDLMTQVHAAFGAVSLSLLFVGLQRHLMAKEQSDHWHAVSGTCVVPVVLKSYA